MMDGLTSPSTIEMPDLVRAKDWSATPLGPMDTWSPSLHLALKLILSSGFPMALRWGPDFVLIYNDGYKPILGDKHPWALGLPAREAWSEVWPTIEPVHLRIYNGEAASLYSEDLLLRIKRHGDRWEDARFAIGYSPVPDTTVPTGVGGVLVSAVETTARYQTEQQLREAQRALAAANSALDAERRFLRDLFQHAPSFMAVLRGPEHRFELANDAYLQVVGHRDVVGKTVREALPEVEGQGFFELLDNVFTTGEPYIGRRMAADLQRRKGSPSERRYLDLVYQPIRGNTGEMLGIFVNGADITDRVEAEDALQRLNADLEHEVEIRTRDRDRIWRLSTDIMLVARYDGTIEAVNPAWTHMLGFSASALIGKSFIDFVHPDDREKTMAEATKLAGGQVTIRFENRYYHADGSIRHLSWTAVPEADLLHAIGRDVTLERETAEALKISEASLRQAQKMEAVGNLTGGIAHDFNNMLAIIMGSLDLASRRLARGETGIERNLANAREGADRAATLTKRLLAFSRQSPLEPQLTDLNRLVSSMSDLIRRTIGEHIALEVVLGAGLWATHVDPNQLETAIINLAVNARDAMPTGGKLTIETANTHIDERYAAADVSLTPGQYAMISVTDTGEGIPADALTKVFDPFFTTKPVGKGTGLGLSMVYGFVKQSGGHAKIYSEAGHGTSLKLYLPRHFGLRKDTEEGPSSTPLAAFGAERILVVEDDERVRQMSVEALTELGYVVYAAANGNDALRLFDTVGGVDILFTDVVMPGMTGRQLADALRGKDPCLRVLFTTGYTRNAIVHNGVLDPGVAFLPKPFSIAELSNKLRSILDS